eukprot:123090-Pelagomonas_calceolata.AAC.2
MFRHALASASLHCLSRALLLFHIIRGASCSAISLISLELYVVVYITRNAGLLVKFEGWEEVVEVGNSAHFTTSHISRRGMLKHLMTFEMQQAFKAGCMQSGQLAKMGPPPTSLSAKLGEMAFP